MSLIHCAWPYVSILVSVHNAQRPKLLTWKWSVNCWNVLVLNNGCWRTGGYSRWVHWMVPLFRLNKYHRIQPLPPPRSRCFVITSVHLFICHQHVSKSKPNAWMTLTLLFSFMLWVEESYWFEKPHDFSSLATLKFYCLGLEKKFSTNFCRVMKPGLVRMMSRWLDFLGEGVQNQRQQASSCGVRFSPSRRMMGQRYVQWHRWRKVEWIEIMEDRGLGASWAVVWLLFGPVGGCSVDGHSGSIWLPVHSEGLCHHLCPQHHDQLSTGEKSLLLFVVQSFLAFSCHRFLHFCSFVDL